MYLGHVHWSEFGNGGERSHAGHEVGTTDVGGAVVLDHHLEYTPRVVLQLPVPVKGH